MSADARSFPRFACEVEVLVWTAEASARGRTQNVSRGGLSALVGARFAIGQRVDARLSLVFDTGTASEPLEIQARVVWATEIAQAGWQIGLAFVNVNEQQASFLDMFLRYLDEGKAQRNDATS